METMLIDADLLALGTEKPKAAAAKKEMPVIILREQDHPGISQVLKDIKELRDSAKENKTRSGNLELELKQIARNEFINLFKKTNRNPTSFKLSGEKGGTLTLTFKNAYSSIDKDRAVQLAQQYDNNIVKAEVDIAINPEMLKKYKAQIIAAINSIQLDEEDIKAGKKVLDVTPKYSIADGAINRMLEFKGADNFIFDINPIISIS